MWAVIFVYQSVKQALAKRGEPYMVFVVKKLLNSRLQPMNNFNNKVAVITGAGGGIGREMALQLAKEGCHLALGDISQQGLDETAKLLEPYGVRVSRHIVDVTDRKRMEALPAEVIDAHGAVNLLVNNAGITLQSSFEDLSIEHWELVIGINLWGVIYGTKAFLPYLKEQGRKGPENAHIINMSSLAGFIGMPNQRGFDDERQRSPSHLTIFRIPSQR